MKLLNPTDDELNAAFAEKVAGWKRLDCDLWDVGLDISSPWCRKRSDGIWISNRTAWTESADAVLPWLEKCAWFEHTGVFEGAKGCSINNCLEGHTVELSLTITSMNAGANAPTFPLAACIALLRANGVEVEFA